MLGSIPLYGWQSGDPFTCWRIFGLLFSVWGNYKDMMDIWVQVSVTTYFLSLVGCKLLRMEWPNPMLDKLWNFEKNDKTLQNDQTVFHLHQPWTRGPVIFTSLQTLGMLRLFNFIQSGVYLVVLYCDHNLHFLNNYFCAASFPVPICHPCILWWNVFCQLKTTCCLSSVGDRSFAIHLLWKYFLSICALPLHFPKCLWKAQMYCLFW